MAIQPFNLQKNLIVNASGNLMCIDARQPFTFKVDTTLGNGFPSFKIPLISGVHNFTYTVNDGTPVQITSYNQPETLIEFPSAGIYEIKIRGKVGNWYDDNTGDVQKYIEVSKFGATEFTSIQAMFYGAINLKLTCNEAINAPNATRADHILRASGITSIPSNIFKRCGKVKAWNFAVSYCSLITGSVPDDLMSNAVSATSLIGMFRDNVNMTGGIHDHFFVHTPNILTLEQFCYNNIRMNGTVGAYVISNLTKLTSLVNFMGFATALNIVLAEDSFLNLTKMTTIAGAYRNTYKTTGTVPSLHNMRLLTSVSTAFYYTRNLAVPAVLFDLNYVYQIASWTNLLSVASTTYSHTGTLQDFWNYANPASPHTGVFMYCTAITNYNDLRLVWPT